MLIFLKIQFLGLLIVNSCNLKILNFGKIGIITCSISAIFWLSFRILSTLLLSFWFSTLYTNIWVLIKLKTKNIKTNINGKNIREGSRAILLKPLAIVIDLSWQDFNLSCDLTLVSCCLFEVLRVYQFVLSFYYEGRSAAPTQYHTVPDREQFLKRN